VAAGLVPLALGTDTGGSVRVPAALCGTFGLKPTYGRLSRRGVFPFSASMDHVGVFARSVADLALAYDALQGPDPDDGAAHPRPADPVGEIAANLAGLKFARADGYFDTHLGPEARAGVEQVADALGATDAVTFSFTEVARAAAFLLSPAEGAQLHQANLARRASDFDPAIRDRLLAGLFTPAAWLMQVQRVRRRYRDAVVAVLERHDVVIAGATPWPAFPVETESLSIDGRSLPAGPNTGMLTQPFSFIGVPVLVVPVVRPGALPVGVQLIAAPGREAVLYRVARALEAAGTVAAPVAAA
jgi:AtzE family amidohydrolase